MQAPKLLSPHSYTKKLQWQKASTSCSLWRTLEGLKVTQASLLHSTLTSRHNPACLNGQKLKKFIERWCHSLTLFWEGSKAKSAKQASHFARTLSDLISLLWAMASSPKSFHGRLQWKTAVMSDATRNMKAHVVFHLRALVSAWTLASVPINQCFWYFLNCFGTRLYKRKYC